MAWQSKANRFTQHLGGKTFQLISGLGFATAVVLSMTPQTVGLNRYRKLTASYKDLTTEIPVDPSTLALIDKVLVSKYYFNYIPYTRRCHLLQLL